MNQLRVAHRAEQARVKALALAAANDTYGVYVWTGKGIYPASEAVKVYKYERVADNACRRLNETNAIYVVRTIRG